MTKFDSNFSLQKVNGVCNLKSCLPLFLSFSFSPPFSELGRQASRLVWLDVENSIKIWEINDGAQIRGIIEYISREEILSRKVCDSEWLSRVQD